MIRGLVGAVYADAAASMYDNIALLFDWTLDVDHDMGHTYGPELHGVPSGWMVTAEAYWAGEGFTGGEGFVRLFIGRGDDPRCLAGLVRIPAIVKMNGICETAVRLDGIGPVTQEG